MKPLPSLRAVFFDVDGTIVLSDPLHRDKLVAVASDPLGTGAPDPARGVAIDLARDWNGALAGIGDHRIFAWLQKKNPAFPLDQQEFLSACEKYYLDHAAGLAVRPGFLPAFKNFARAGMHMAAVSSGVRAQVDCNLAVANVAHRLLFADSADETKPGQTKPHPAPYLNGLKKMNALLAARDPQHREIAPGECLVVEDSLSGARAGVAAGMLTAHWRLEKTGPRLETAHFRLPPDAGQFVALARRLARRSA
jgi:beta-phosphoglucomutase-like phosphatase (HAD superfamily)